MSGFKKSIQMLAVIPLTMNTILGLGDTDNQATLFPKETILAQKEIPLGNRDNNQFVNDVFKDNILLNLAYMAGRVGSAKDIKWEEITKPFQYEFILNPSKTFAYHSDIQSKYKDSLTKTTGAHFNAADGFKTDGYLFGDGICHLASLINWVAQEAGLFVEAPTNHDFAPIPDIPKQYGVSIYSNPNAHGSNTLQNLYITNNKGKPITFRFQYIDNKVKVSIVN